eukprot:CAMPEP_0184744532 /NCGR_PEP_ID=MMETSP0315-20130426/7248_1 /TAXON_ID=101924 /ORGANISM="Rhodosorus marinus, Strain UTEX LB 2760" /LENGTH=291 /DNA_ID=CAMNT_0027216243 /DNA_START=189 /DNA_END=1064 /DNA_ORIENTATION=-
MAWAAFVCGFSLQARKVGCQGSRLCMSESDCVRTAPPTVPEALHMTIKESIRNAVLSGQLAMRVDVRSGETDPDSPIYDEMMVVTVAAQAVDSMLSMLGEESRILIVSDLTTNVDLVATRLVEASTALSQSKLRVVAIPEDAAGFKVDEDEDLVVILSPTNQPGRSVTKQVRQIVRAAFGRRTILINQRLDYVVGVNADGSEKRVGMLPVEINKFETAYVWEMCQIRKKGTPTEKLEDLDMVLIVHRKYPEPICIFRLDTMDRVCSLVHECGSSLPSHKNILTIAARLMDE